MITLEIDSPQYDTYSGEIDSPVYHTQGDWLHGILYSGEIDSPGYHPQGDFTTIFNDWLSRLWYSGEIDLLGYYTLGDYLVGVSYPGEIFILMVELIKKIFQNLRAGADNLSLTDSPADFSLFFWLAPATKFCNVARYFFFIPDLHIIHCIFLYWEQNQNSWSKNFPQKRRQCPHGFLACSWATS